MLRTHILSTISGRDTLWPLTRSLGPFANIIRDTKCHKWCGTYGNPVVGEFNYLPPLQKWVEMPGQFSGSLFCSCGRTLLSRLYIPNPLGFERIYFEGIQASTLASMHPTTEGGRTNGPLNITIITVGPKLLSRAHTHFVIRINVGHTTLQPTLNL